MDPAKNVSLILLIALTSSAIIAHPTKAESSSWSEPVPIGDGLGGQSWTPSGAANIHGNMIAAWTVWIDSSTEYVFANRYLPGQGWNGPEILAEGSVMGGCAAGIDDSGDCLVMWAQGPSIQSRTYKTGVGWEPTVLIASSATARWFYDIKLAVAPDGAAMAIWCQDSQDAYGPFYSAYKPAGGEWQEPEEFQSTSPTVMNVRLANDGVGNFLVAFTMYDDSHWGVWANIFAPDIGWGEEMRIESQIHGAYDLNVATSRAGHAMVVWQQFGYPDWNSPTAFANHYTPEDGWGTETPIEELNSGGCDPPAVAIDEAGNAVAIWRRVSVDATSTSLRTNTYVAGEDWGSPSTLEGSRDSIDVHVSAGVAGDEAFAAWIRIGTSDSNFTGNELVANHFDMTSGWEGPVTITTGNMSSPNVVADNLGGGAVFWYGNEIVPDIFVSHYRAMTTPPATVIASVDIRPDTVNLKRTDKYLTAYIELPEGYDVRDVLLDSITLDGEVATVGPCDIGDYDRDDVDDLMVKFDFSEVSELYDTVTPGTATITVYGALVNGTLFEGSEEVNIVSQSRISAIITSILGLGVSVGAALASIVAAGIGVTTVLMLSRRRKLLHKGGSRV